MCVYVSVVCVHCACMLKRDRAKKDFGRTCNNLVDGGETTKHIFIGDFWHSSRCLGNSLKNGLFGLTGMVPSMVLHTFILINIDRLTSSDWHSQAMRRQNENI